MNFDSYDVENLTDYTNHVRFLGSCHVSWTKWHKNSLRLQNHAWALEIVLTQ